VRLTDDVSDICDLSGDGARRDEIKPVPHEQNIPNDFVAYSPIVLNSLFMGLTRVDLDELLTSRQVAEYLGTTEQVLAVDRYRGRGLPYVRVGRRIRYRASQVRAYIDANTENPGA
jgi:hypothetical protein